MMGERAEEPAVLTSAIMGSQTSNNVGAIQMKKDIGVLRAVSIIFGVIVGSGIFVSPVGVLKYTNSVGLSLIMWVVPGIFSMLGALVYAELGVRIPKSGGEYVYILEAFGGFPAFLVMWVTFVIIGGVTCAANSLIFAKYILYPLYPDCVIPNHIVNMTALAGLSHDESFKDAFENSNTSPGFLAIAFYQGFWAFAGWSYLNFLVEEMKNPSRDLPLAITIALLLVTILYVLTNVAYLAVLSPSEMLQSNSESVVVAVIFAKRAMPWLVGIVPILVGASVFGSINGGILSISRLTYSGAREGHLPKILALIHYQNLTPIPAILELLVLSVGFQMYKDVLYLIELAGFSFSLIAALAVSALIYLRVTHREVKTEFQLPLALPVFFLLSDLFILALTIYQQPWESCLNVLLILMAVPLYFLGVYWKHPKCVRSKIHSLTVTLQKVFACVQPDPEVFAEVKDDESNINPTKKKSKGKEIGGVDAMYWMCY
ncbi:hypothetical protein Aperf_G00000109470 [Anoplocephala perfoliata]